MSIESLFRIVTGFAAVCVATSALLHILLLASDSPEYRAWVAIQIVLQLFTVVLLWLVRRYNSIALFLLFVLAIPFTYINAVYTNYGNMGVQVFVVTLCWALYGYLLYSVRGNFQKRMRDISTSDT